MNAARHDGFLRAGDVPPGERVETRLGGLAALALATRVSLRRERLFLRRLELVGERTHQREVLAGRTHGRGRAGDVARG